MVNLVGSSYVFALGETARLKNPPSDQEALEQFRAGPVAVRKAQRQRIGTESNQLPLL